MVDINIGDFVVMKSSIFLKQYRRKKYRVLYVVRKIGDDFLGKHIYLHPSNYTKFYFSTNEVDRLATKAEIVSYKNAKLDVPIDDYSDDVFHIIRIGVDGIREHQHFRFHYWHPVNLNHKTEKMYKHGV